MDMLTSLEQVRRGSGIKGLGDKLLHHMVRHCDHRETAPPVLISVSSNLKFLRANSHLLKLVTGVDTSTRPVNKSGRPGEAKRRSRTAAAAPNRLAFPLSKFISPV